MRKSEEHEAEDVRGSQDRTRKRLVFLLAGLLFTIIVATTALLYLREHALGHQLRVLAGDKGSYREEICGPRWYLRMADKLGLPMPKQPVTFRSREVTDADLVVVGKADSLVVLDLAGSQISDSGLIHLKGLTKMQSLGLRGTGIGDAGLAHLGGLSDFGAIGFVGNEGE